MPIRFRCCYCSQLLGISRRKIGTVIQCPNCLGQVWVPDPNQPGEDNPVPPPFPGQEAYQGNPAYPDQGGAYWPGGSPVIAPEPIPTLVLTPARLALMVLVMLLGLVMFFGLGVWLGRALKRSSPPASVTTFLPDLTPRLRDAQALETDSRMHEPGPL